MIDIFTVAKELNLKGKYKDRIYINSSGTQAFFICPFKHKDQYGKEYEEKEPSFTINIDTGKFYCFACGNFGTTIEELYKKLGKEYKHSSKEYNHNGKDYNEQNHSNILHQNKLSDLYKKIYSSFSSINYEFVKEYLNFRNIKANNGFIDFFGLNVVHYKQDEYLFVIRESNNIDGIYFGSFICRKFRYNGGKIENDVKGGKYLTITGSNNSILYPYNRDSIKFLIGNGVILVESTMDSIKLSSYRIKNMSTLGANVKKGYLDYFSSLKNFYLKYYIIPQNDKAGLLWLNTLVRFFDSEKILYEIIQIPSDYKDLCEIESDDFFVDLLQKITK